MTIRYHNVVKCICDAHSTYIANIYDILLSFKKSALEYFQNSYNFLVIDSILVFLKHHFLSELL